MILLDLCEIIVQLKGETVPWYIWLIRLLLYAKLSYNLLTEVLLIVEACLVILAENQRPENEDKINRTKKNVFLSLLSWHYEQRQFSLWYRGNWG